MAATTIRDLGKEMAQREREQRQAEITASLGAEMNPDNKTPFQDQNEFLANEVKKIGEASAERARLQSEQAREEYDNQVRANIIKEKEHAENSQQAADSATSRSQTRNFTEAKAIARQLSAIPRRPGQTDHTRPMDELRQESNLLQQLEAIRVSDPSITIDVMTKWAQEFAQESNTIVPQHAQPQPVQPQPARPFTFADGSEYLVTKTNDGYEVRLATGEIFKGNTDEVLAQLAKSKMETRKWADGFKNKLEKVQTNPNDYSGLSLSDAVAAEQAEAFARQLGFSNKAELMQWGEQYQQDRAVMEEFRVNKMQADFQMANPDFPNTAEAYDAMMKIIDGSGWELNLSSLNAAHSLAVRQGQYKPLTPEMIAAANGTPVQQTRPTPPPLVRGGGNPEMSNPAPDPWSMNLADLRRQAIKAQLEGGQ